MSAKTETVNIGPFRIPKQHKEGLERLKSGRSHITMSDLVREAIFLLLVKRGIIEVEEEWGEND